MLQLAKALVPRSQDGSGVQAASPNETKISAASVIKHQWPIFVTLVACSVLLGLLYLFTTPPSYTATATMVIDTRKVQLFQQQSVLGDIAIDAGTVQTQVEILRSEKIALSVIRDLHLDDDPEFTGEGAGLFGAIFGTFQKLFAPEGGRSETAQLHRALSAFEKQEAINRVGLTYVMEISFRSYDANKAANIANAIADAYVVDQLEAKYQATKRAGLWLQNRIDELRLQSTAAERAVVDFKQNNKIVASGGRLMNDQQLAEVNSQLILAHAATVEAKARLDNINEIMKQPIPDGSVADVLKSEVIIQLRNKYLEIAQRESMWSSKYGPTHLATISLRNQMQEILRNIRDEMAKIAESYKSDYEVARARENAMRTSFDQTVSASQATDQAQIKLRELESSSQSFRAMYDSFLQRYMEAVQQQSFPITEARVVSPATTPPNPSQPNTFIVLLLVSAGGISMSFGVAFLREMADRVFRSATQVEERLLVSCIATIPITRLESWSLPDKLFSLPSRVWSRPFNSGASVNLVAPGENARRDRKKSPGDGQLASAGAREISSTPSLLRYVIDRPFSQFTEAYRSIKVAIDLNGAAEVNRIIGVTSSLPNEGKTTTSSNLASLIAHAGAKAILVDADLRNPSLSMRLAPKAKIGLVDVLAGKAELESVLWRDAKSGLVFLPVGNSSQLNHPNETLGSEPMRKLFVRLRELYDYVIVDLAPLAPVVDARTTVNFIDAYLFVVEWGRTKIDIAEHSLSAAAEIQDRLLGVVLNKADMGVLSRYEHYSSYYYGKYSRYPNVS